MLGERFGLSRYMSCESATTASSDDTLQRNMSMEFFFVIHLSPHFCTRDINVRLVSLSQPRVVLEDLYADVTHSCFFLFFFFFHVYLMTGSRTNREIREETPQRLNVRIRNLSHFRKLPGNSKHHRKIQHLDAIAEDPWPGKRFSTCDN